MSADNDLLVITAATSDSGGMLPQYREQLARAGIPFHIEIMASPSDASIATMLVNLRRRAEQFSQYGRLVMTDAFDVVFFGTKEEVIAKIPLDHVLWGAEKNCFSDVHLSGPILNRYPDQGPWFFVNGGLLTGTPQAIIDLTLAVEKEKLYAPFFINQTFLNILRASGSELVEVDYRCELFQCLHLGYPELEFEKGKMVNTKWGTRPSFAHANGGWSPAEMWEKYQRSIL
jgi:hypothetical protein